MVKWHSRADVRIYAVGDYALVGRRIFYRFVLAMSHLVCICLTDRARIDDTRGENCILLLHMYDFVLLLFLGNSSESL